MDGGTAMLEAVARGKAGGLLSRHAAGAFGTVRRPQEDLVTSAVLGTLTFLPAPDRRRALDCLLGDTARSVADLPPDGDVTVGLWPSLPGAGERFVVEPDAIVAVGGRVVIVEVKWHAPLPGRQIADEIAAALAHETNRSDTGSERREVAALLLLGGMWSGPDELDGVPVIGRTWRNLSADLAPAETHNATTDTPFRRWRDAVGRFLRATDLGHVFTGLNADALGAPGKTTYRFGPGRGEPWLAGPFGAVGDTPCGFWRNTR